MSGQEAMLKSLLEDELGVFEVTDFESTEDADLIRIGLCLKKTAQNIYFKALHLEK